MTKIENFPYSIPIPAKIWGCSLWSRSVMLGSAESEMVELISREIIFAEFQPIWSRYLNVTDGQTDGQTDNLPWQYSATRSFARQKCKYKWHVMCQLNQNWHTIYTTDYTQTVNSHNCVLTGFILLADPLSTLRWPLRIFDQSLDENPRRRPQRHYTFTDFRCDAVTCLRLGYRTRGLHGGAENDGHEIAGQKLQC